MWFLNKAHEFVVVDEVFLSRRGRGAKYLGEGSHEAWLLSLLLRFGRNFRLATFPFAAHGQPSPYRMRYLPATERPVVLPPNQREQRMKNDTPDIFLSSTELDDRSSESHALAKLLPPGKTRDRILKAAHQDKAMAEMKRRVAEGDDIAT